MIISKDLFIFGEQIFATIIPESGSSQGSQQQQQQQHHQQQQPAIIDTNQPTATTPAINTPLSAATAINSGVPTAAGALAGEQVAGEPIKPAAGALTTKTLSKQETVAVVVAVAAAAAATAKKVKIAKIPKESEIKREKQLHQQSYQHHNQQQQQQHQQKLVNNANGTYVRNPREKCPVSLLAEDEEVPEAPINLAEKEPLVKRNSNKIVPPTTTSAPKAARELQQHSALQQQHHTEQCPSATNSKKPPAPVCRLPLEPLEQPAAPPVEHATTTTSTTTTTSIPITTTTTTALAAAAVATDLNRNQALGGGGSAKVEDLSLKMDNKAMLGNSASTDHTTVTFPFISDQHRSLQLTFQNITVLHNDRKILSDISGLVSPGEVLAIMGPSGSGKTTLLDCLSGQRRIDSGSIQLNREPLCKKWRRKIGYVLQEEVFFAGLTLKETVMYTAFLRLPEKMPKADKLKLVNRILDTLELNFCQQTKFGDYLNRGLSGGEKKRANIACELLTNPLLMLLDEPTSGLDSHSAISLMKVLKRYAMQEQKTVVITVHQPSSQMFHMFDKLLLLYNGRTAYFGEVANIYRYFEDIGVAIKPHYNPADFVLEKLKSFPDIREKLFVAAKESHGNFLNRNCITLHANQTHHHHQHHSKSNGITVTSANGAKTEALASDKKHQHDSLINDIIKNYYNDIQSNHNHHHISHNEATTLMMNTHHHDSCEESNQHLWFGNDGHSNFSCTSSDCQQYEKTDEWLDYPTRFHTQFRVLSSRNFKEAKPRMLSKLNWFQTVGLALMAGAIWFQLPRTEEFLHDLQGWMFFSQTYWMLFALFGALNSFPSEREVISKERRSGAYRLSAYYLAKMCGELPLVITLPTVYLIISYPMLGCSSFKLFFLMLVFLLLNTMVAQSVGFFIGACCMDMNVSITLSALYTLATQLFGGYLSRIPEGLSWIRYTSMIHYAYQNMQILEFREGPSISCGNPSSYEVCKNETLATVIPYEEILKAQNSTSPLWLNTFILMMFFLVFRCLGYAVLRYVRCPKT